MSRNLAYHNPPPEKGFDMVGHVPPEYVKAEFAKRLSHQMLLKGWTQSDLARAAARQSSTGTFGRDLVSNYVRGLHFPQPKHLQTLCKALGCEPEDLIPPQSVPSAEDRAPPCDVRDMGDGMVFVRLNKRLPWAKALKILELSQGEE